MSKKCSLAKVLSLKFQDPVIMTTLPFLQTTAAHVSGFKAETVDHPQRSNPDRNDSLNRKAVVLLISLDQEAIT